MPLCRHSGVFLYCGRYWYLSYILYVPVVIILLFNGEFRDYFLSFILFSYRTRTQLFIMPHLMDMRSLWTYYLNNPILKLMQLIQLVQNYNTTIVDSFIKMTICIVIVPILVQLVSKLKNIKLWYCNRTLLSLPPLFPSSWPLPLSSYFSFYTSLIVHQNIWSRRFHEMKMNLCDIVGPY